MTHFILLLSVLVFFKKGMASEDLVPVGRALHLNTVNFSAQHQHHQNVPDSLPGYSFSLKVRVLDALSRQDLRQATVDVYVNHSRTSKGLTDEDGVAQLLVPCKAGLPITVVASKFGFILTSLSWITEKIPIFASMSLIISDLNQGNIWLYEDSIRITGKTSDLLFQPSVQFSKKLLNLTDGSDVSSFKAYMTVPEFTTDSTNVLNILGIISHKSGYTSIELRPVAAVSIQIFNRDAEIHVNGPFEITLPLPDHCGLRSSTAVPAWFFNLTTGGWMTKGLGMVLQVDGKLLWTFSAPHLGYWIAAPFSSSRGFMGFAVTIDFISHHSYFLIAILGATLLILICLLVFLLCRHSSPSDIKTKKVHGTKCPAVLRKDQTTSTYNSELFEVSTGHSQHLANGSNQSSTEREEDQDNDSVISKPKGTLMTSPKTTAHGLIHFDENAIGIMLKCSQPDLNVVSNDETSLHKLSQQMRVPLSQRENLLFYNHPVAILHAPAFFHMEEQPEQPLRSKSVTSHRSGDSSIPTHTEPLSKEDLSVLQNHVPDSEVQLEVAEGSMHLPIPHPPRCQYTLPESVSVPGTLNQISENRLSCSPAHMTGELQGNSEHDLVELSRIPSPLPPRAWFVSLEGKPAADIHRSVSEQQRRRRPVESRDTSLDSGVDMSELNQTTTRRVLTLERNATFVKSTPGNRSPSTQ